MNTENITLFVFDESSHFNDNIQFLGKESFKDIIHINSVEDLDNNIQSLNDNDWFTVIVHVFFTKKIKGIKRYLSSGINKKYPFLDVMYVSDGDKRKIQHEMIDNEMEDTHKVKFYHQIQSELEKGKFSVYTKSNISEKNSSDLTISHKIPYPQIDYVIITALEEGEMEKVLPMIEFESRIDDEKHLIEYGFFKSNPEKKVAYASQLETGMIDASILASKMIIMFRPKYIIMTGVLGGKPDSTKIGDIIISTKVFTIDKGKIVKHTFKKEIESENTNSSIVTSLKRHKKKILRFIEDEDSTRDTEINLHFEPTVTVRSVIDKPGYFKAQISSNDRKAVGLEMEGYGVARACALVNNGVTIPLICKAVMDNTQDKQDGSKIYAAWTSAKVIEYSIINNLL